MTVLVRASNRHEELDGHPQFESRRERRRETLSWRAIDPSHMEDIFVAQLMTPDLHTVTPDTLVEDAANHLLAEEIGSLVVVDEDNQLEGILTKTDFVRIVAERKPKDQTPVSAYMTTDVLTTTGQASIRDAADAMLEHDIHHLPVVEDDEGVIGIVTTTDLAAYLSRVQTPSPS
jgi:CBS domain-containing protein